MEERIYSKRESEVVHLYNFVIGLTLLILSLFVMFSGESLILDRGVSLDIALLFIVSVASLTLSMTKNDLRIFYGNICLGVLSFLIAVLSFLVLLFDATVWWEPLFHFNRGDVFFHILITLAFIYTAYLEKSAVRFRH